MKKVIVSLLVAGSVFAVSSCKKSTPTPSTNARVMFVNGCSGSSALGLSVDSANVTGATSVNFLDSSGYQNVGAGSVTMSVFISSNLSPLGTLSTSLTANSNYSIFIGGLIQNSQNALFITTDDLTAPTSGDAKIRLVNTCSDTTTANVTGFVETSAGVSTSISSSVAYKAASGFIEVPAGTYQVRAGSTSAGNAVQTTQNINATLNSGKIYTVVFAGTNPVYQLKVIANN